MVEIQSQGHTHETHMSDCSLPDLLPATTDVGGREQSTGLSKLLPHPCEEREKGTGILSNVHLDFAVCCVRRMVRYKAGLS